MPSTHLPEAEDAIALLRSTEFGRVDDRPQRGCRRFHRDLLCRCALVVAGLGGLVLLASRGWAVGAWGFGLSASRHEEAPNLRASISAAAAASEDLNTKLVATEDVVVDPCTPDIQKGGCYDESEDVPGYKKLGNGYCAVGFYAGLLPLEAVDLATCAKKCSSDSDCKYFSFVLGQTCSRFSVMAGSCNLYKADLFAAAHQTYAKQTEVEVPEEPSANETKAHVSRSSSNQSASEGANATAPAKATPASVEKDRASKGRSSAGNATDSAAANSTSGTAENSTNGTAANSTNGTAENSTNGTAENSTNGTALNATRHAEVTTTLGPAYLRRPNSLYCWLLCQANSNEAELVRRSYQKRQGIFGCDAFDVLADYKFDIGGDDANDRLTTIGDVTSKWAWWGSVANELPFLKAWDTIIDIGRYWEYAWTVKVDPDTAFVSSRLRGHLQGKPTDHAVWIRNWGQSFGLLGPIEIFTAFAVREYKNRKDECVGDGKGLSNAGEDGFIGTCVGQVLQIQSVQDLGVLDGSGNMGHCYQQWGAPALHPFKDPNALSQCLQGMTR